MSNDRSERQGPPPRGNGRRPGGGRHGATPARRASWAALDAVERGTACDEALSTALAGVSDPGERSLTWQLVLGVLRQRSLLDAVIEGASKRTVRNIDPAALQCLRIGVLELRFLRTPAHAAVDQAVELARAVGVGHAATFVNAVLRHQGEISPSAEASLGHPAWLVARWRARWGERADQWMEANNHPAEVYLVPKEDPAGVSRIFQHSGITLVPERGALRLPPRLGAIDALPGYDEGRWWVMDPAALAVADLVPEVASALDMCAAPGGKTFRLAARGIAVTAADVAPARLLRLLEGAERLGFTVVGGARSGSARSDELPGSILAIQSDWGVPEPVSKGRAGRAAAGPVALDPRIHHEIPGERPGPDGRRRWPAVLLDAPCTGLGTLRRNPDIRWRRRETDIAAAAVRQRVLIREAAARVAPGGSLIYAVCSTEPEEGPEVAASLGWPIREVLDTSPSGIGVGEPILGHDAFWACRMERP